MKRVLLVCMFFVVSLVISACSTDAQSDPVDTLKEVITKASSGDPAQMMEVGSLVYNMQERPELVKRQVDHFLGHKEDGEIITQKVKLLIGENPTMPQTDSYKHYIIYLPKEEAAKLQAKYAYYGAMNLLSEGMQVGMIEVDGKWYVDLAYENLEDSVVETNETIDLENMDIDWEEIDHEMSISFDPMPYDAANE